MTPQHSLAQKTSLPSRLPNVVRRRRLIDALYQGIQKKVSIITAPAGSGKTTVLTDFAADCDIPVCWYTLEESDRHPRSLIEGLILSVARRYPGAGSGLSAVLESSMQPEKQANTIIDALAHEIDTVIREYMVFVIEDFHLVEDYPAVKNILGRLIEVSPDNCHFVITGRNPFTLPVIAGLSMKRQVTRISAHQFALSREEITELYTSQFGVVPSPQQVESLLEETRGWVPALLLHGFRGSAETPVNLSREDMYTYIAEQVFRAQTPPVQDFLLKTAVLDELSPEFCDSFLDGGNSSLILQELYIKNLFITRLEGEKPLYRYHSLLRDFLLHHLEANRAQQLLALHGKAAQCLEKERQWDLAVSQYIKAHKPAGAVRLILEHSENYVRSGKWSVVLNWLESLPKSVSLTMPDLIALRALTMIYRGDSTEAARMLTEIITRESYGKNRMLYARLLNWRCAAFRMMGRFDDAKRDIIHAIKLFEELNGPGETIGECYRRLGDIYAEQGILKSALRYQKAALRQFQNSVNLSLISQVHNSIGIIYKRSGQLTTAGFHFEQAREGWSKLNNFSALSVTLNNIGLVYQRQGQYELALDTLNTGLKASKNHGYKRTESCLLISMGEVLRDMGLYKDALVSFEQGLEIAREVVEPYFVTYALIGSGEVYRLMGDIDRAQFYLSEARLQAESRRQRYESTLIRLQLASIDYACGRYSPANTGLNECLAYFQQIDDKEGMAKTYFCLAHCAFLSKKYQTIRSYIGNMERLLQQFDHHGFLISEGRQAVLLLQYCISRKLGADIFNRVLEKIRKMSATVKSTAVPRVSAPPKELHPAIKVKALGEIRVWVGEHLVTEEEWRSSRAKEIFVYLLTAGATRTKEQIATALWPDISSAKATSNFHVNLYRARRALSPVLFAQSNGRYRINPEFKIDYDLIEFKDLLKSAKTGLKENKLEMMEKAAELYRGPFAMGLDSEWAENYRREAENVYIDLLVDLSGTYIRQSATQKALAMLEILIQNDPYNDFAYCECMKLQIAGGDYNSARRTYSDYCRIVIPETRKPSPDIQALYRQLIDLVR